MAPPAEPAYFLTDSDDVDHNIGVGWHYDEELVKLGYTRYRNSGFAHLPHPEDLLQYDKGWLADMQAMHQFVESKRPVEEDNGQPRQSIRFG